MGIVERLHSGLERLRNRGTDPVDTSGQGPTPVSEFMVESPGQAQALKGSYEPFTKWWHYFKAYDEEFAALKSRIASQGNSVGILEIGVWRGGSLQYWNEYFSGRARVFGIDIDPSCASLDVSPAQVRIGSQADRDFLISVVGEMGGLDVVIDDGSHNSSDVISSFEILFPLLSEGGVYVIEDLHASYWPWYGGGYRHPNSSIEALKGLVDDQNRAAFTGGSSGRLSAVSAGQVWRVTFYDSMAFVWKGRRIELQKFESESA